MAKAKTQKDKKRSWKGWIIALSIIAVIVIVITIIMCVNTYSPHENYYGSGNVWSERDNFDDYYKNMLSLTFDEDRPLRIMQIADPQLKFGFMTSDKKTFDLLDKAIDQLQPDIAVVTGDLTFSLFAKTAVKYFADFMEKKQVYWTYVYGNHDSEMSLSKYRHSQLLAKYDYCLFDGGPANIKGESNYFVNIKNSNDDLLYALCMIDSNMYPDTKEDIFEMKYDEIQQNQVDWYSWVTTGLQGKNAKLQSAMFMHIPLKQFVSVYTSGNYVGSVCEMSWEDNGVEAPGIYYQGGNGGLSMYDAIVNLGCTKCVFVGHDHINTLRGQTSEGILLAYGRNCGYHTYPFFESQGSMGFVEDIFADLFGYTGASMYLDQWVDQNGNYLGKGVSIMEIDVNVTSATYGQIYMYDVNHDSLNNGIITKQHEITAN